MNIGSCKPGKADLTGTRHYLIDIVDPDYQFTVGEFCSRAEEACNEIFAKQKIPLFAGGTGLYINSFFYGISEIPELDRKIKVVLSAEAEEKGLAHLFDELAEADPDYASKIHINDRQRIIRGLEVYRGTGRPLSDFHKTGKREIGSETLFIGLYVEKEVLNRRIEERVDEMIQKGLIEEVEGLRGMGYSPDLNSMKSIGYSEINDYLDGKLGLDEAVRNIKTNTKRYAKKQMTWFKRMSNVTWYKAEETKIIKDKIKNWLNQ